MARPEGPRGQVTGPAMLAEASSQGCSIWPRSRQAGLGSQAPGSLVWSPGGDPLEWELVSLGRTAVISQRWPREKGVAAVWVFPQRALIRLGLCVQPSGLRCEMKGVCGLLQTPDQPAHGLDQGL